MLKTSQSRGHSGSDPAAADIVGSHPHAGHPGSALPDERTIRENFPVALRILPARHRKGLSAVYRYARLVDDIGDEAPPAERGRLLDLVDRDIDRVYAGQAPELPALRAIGAVAREHGIPEAPLRKLVQANRQDQEVLRYDTWDQLVEYCTLSADPVGHLVLYVFDAATPERIALSDRICTALQVIEHCQDVAEDFAAGRVYLPAEDLKLFGCTDADLGAATTPTRLRGAIARNADRAAGLLDAGAPLIRKLDGWARISVAGYLAGGRATLTALRAGAYDVHAARLRPSHARTLADALLILGGK
jgi:squalene synthase HpnC